METGLIKEWDVESESEFWKTYRKKRLKLDFVKLTANQLIQKSKKQIAINLLAHFVADYQLNKQQINEKQKYPSLYKSDIMNICVRISKIHEDLSNPTQAEFFLQKGEAIYSIKETDENLKPRSAWEGYLDMTRFYLKSNELGLAANALHKFETCHENHNSYGVFMNLHAQLAKIQANFTESDRVHNARREWNGQLSFKAIENQDYHDSTNEVSNAPQLAAEAIIVYHHTVSNKIYDKNKTALEVLEVLFNKNEDYMLANYQEDFLNKQLIPELGAYLGEVLINSFNGTWFLDDKLMKCRIKVGQRIVNPFQYAFNIVHLKHSLIEGFYKVEETAIRV